MNTKNTLKLKVFESGFSKEDTTELLVAIESATTIDDLDRFNKLFEEKAREYDYEFTYAYTSNEKYIKGLRDSEYADEFSEVISLVEKFNKEYLEGYKNNMGETELIHLYSEHCDKVYSALEKKTLELQMEVVKIQADTLATHSEVKEMQAKLKEAESLKKKIKDITSDMKANYKKAFEKVKKSAEEGKDKLSEKADELKKKIGDLKSDK